VAARLLVSRSLAVGPTNGVVGLITTVLPTRRFLPFAGPSAAEARGYATHRPRRGTDPAARGGSGIWGPRPAACRCRSRTRCSSTGTPPPSPAGGGRECDSPVDNSQERAQAPVHFVAARIRAAPSPSREAAAKGGCNGGSPLLRPVARSFSDELTPDLDLQRLFVVATGVRSRVTNKPSKSLILGPPKETRSKSVSSGEPIYSRARTVRGGS
jgi:hypothetical protein